MTLQLYTCRRAVTPVDEPLLDLLSYAPHVVDSLAPYSVYVVNRCPPQAENFGVLSTVSAALRLQLDML